MTVSRLTCRLAGQCHRVRRRRLQG